MKTVKIERIARILSGAALLIGVIPPIFFPLYFFYAAPDSIADSVNLLPSIVKSDLKTWQRLACGGTIELPVLCMTFGMLQARKCFTAFSKGLMFTAPAIGYMRRFAAWMLASTLCSILIIPVMSVLLTASNPDGKLLVLSVTTDHLLTLPRIAMMWLLAAVIAQGHSLAARDAGSQ